MLNTKTRFGTESRPRPLMKTHFRPLRILFLAASLLAGVRGTFADTELWVGIPGSSATTNWSDPDNWSGTSRSPNNNTVFFINNGPTAAGTVDNVVDTSTNCYALNYTNTARTHTTLIPPGQTLTIDGNNNGQA